MEDPRHRGAVAEAAAAAVAVVVDQTAGMDGAVVNAVQHVAEKRHGCHRAGVVSKARICEG